MAVKVATDRPSMHDAFSSGTAGRHETFTPRYGWVFKGYDRCCKNGHVFNDTNAIEQLGVGKNMVRSIRFWCILFRLLEDAEAQGHLRRTAFGKSLLDSQTVWDPYPEDPASLWLLHWQVFRPPWMAVSWNLACSSVTPSASRPNELSYSSDFNAQRSPQPNRVAVAGYLESSRSIPAVWEAPLGWE